VPKVYYERIRTFLEHCRPTGPSVRPSRGEILAFVKSFWLLGVRCSGRLAYWRLFWSTLLRRLRQFPCTIELMILGYHFRRVAAVM
jgi:hypothetical protein